MLRLRGLRAGAALLLPASIALSGTRCVSLSRPGPPPPAPGVVLVLADAFEPGVEASHTPALTRLAARGRSFELAFAPDPEPAAARHALLRPGGLSLASLFRARGAAIAAVGGRPALALDPDAADLELGQPYDDARDGSQLESWLRRHRSRFLVVATISGGGKGAVPPALAAGEPAAPLPRIVVDDLGFADRPGGSLRPIAWSPASRRRAEAAALERSIAADHVLDGLLRRVAAAAPEAAIVLVGDPPADRGAHGRVARPGLFDDTLRSLLVVATPGLARPGRPARHPVSTDDVGATLLDLAGLAPEPSLAGRSLIASLADPSAGKDREALSSTGRKAPRVGRSARSERWRYTEWPDGSAELYDHQRDPGEHVNLAARPELRETIEVLSRAFFAVPAPAPAAGRGTDVGRRNVVLLIVDDLNTRLGAWGAPVRTPSIDRLAERGVRFERAYAPVAMCSPSRVSVLTGWRPERTGIWNNQDPPRPAGAVPLQEHFAAHGAQTVAIGKIYHFPADFRWTVREEHPMVEEEPEGTGLEQGFFVAASGGDLAQPDGQRALRAARLLERLRHRPFFLALGLVRPHRRWIAPARYFAMYPPAAIVADPFPPDDLADVPAIAVKTRPQPLPGQPLLGREPPGLVGAPELRRQAIAAYQACTTFADAQVGVLLAALDRLGLWRDTVVVLMGDNGYHLGEHAGLLRKDTLFEEALRVPLIIAAPGLRPAVVRAPVELVDLYPTLVQLAGLPAVDGLDGRSLAPLLAVPDAPGRGPALSFRRVQPPERGWSLRTPSWRYTVWPDGSEELYDVRTGAAANLAARPERAGDKARLRARLTELVLARLRPGEG